MIGRLAGPMGQVAVMERGRSSGVEHNLAKVGVEGSNPFARSSFCRDALVEHFTWLWHRLPCPCWVSIGPLSRYLIWAGSYTSCCNGLYATIAFLLLSGRYS